MSTGLLHKAMRILTAATMLAAVATVLSCNKSTTDPEPQQGPAIEFNAADNWTKAVIPSGTEGVAALQQDERGFKVWSWFQGTTSGPMFGAEGTKVAYNGSAWDYKPKRYWMNGTYDFAAVYPSTVSGTYAPETTGTSPVLKVTNFDVTTQDDLLVAFKTGVNGANPPSEVALNFKHALSNIQLQLALDRDDFFIDEDGDDFKEKQVGRAYVSIVGFNNIATKANLSAASSNNADIQWNPKDANGQLRLNYSQNPVQVTAGYTDFLGEDGVLTIPQSLISGNGELYMQVIIYPLGNANESITKEFRVPLKSGGPTVWKPNTKYLYQGEITQELVIDFNVVKVNDWEDGESLGGFNVS